MKIKPKLQLVHYITDSPANQYRNRSIVKLVSEHAKNFPGVSATWEFLEAGHGKGPCDGVGASLKKQAEISVKRGRVIKCASEFVYWANTEQTTIEVFEITERDISSAAAKLKNSEYVKGISSAHSIRPGATHVVMRETSCYDDCCRHEPTITHEWQKTSIRVVTAQKPSATRKVSRSNSKSVSQIPEEVNTVMDSQLVTQIGPERRSSRSKQVEKGTTQTSSVTYKIGNIVHFRIRKEEFLGQIEKCDYKEEEYLMKYIPYTRKKRISFPRFGERIWIEKRFIFGIHSS